MIGSFSGCAILDIYAGTGNLGIEALSRGAAEAVFIDNHRDSVALVKKNLEMTGFSERSRVFLRDSIAALKSLEESGRTFQLVFIDPPYQQELLEKVMFYLASSSLIDATSFIIAEFSSKENPGAVFGHLREIDRRTYGDTALAFFTLQTGGLTA
jgi:16S rRNA (guanine(966)-N(2))-methyltransferase RsmD